jgi:hypothetical protein
VWALTNLEHDPEKLKDFSGKIMRKNKRLERDDDSKTHYTTLGVNGVVLARHQMSSHRVAALIASEHHRL